MSSGNFCYSLFCLLQGILVIKVNKPDTMSLKRLQGHWREQEPFASWQSWCLVTHSTKSFATYLHPRGISSFDDGYRLACVDSILAYGVSIQVTYCFHLVCLPVQLNFIRLHDFLYPFTDITQSDINPGFLEGKLEYDRSQDGGTITHDSLKNYDSDRWYCRTKAIYIYIGYIECIEWHCARSVYKYRHKTVAFLFLLL